MTLSQQKSLGVDCSADFHVHIGQFNQHYYPPENVITAVAECGVKNIVFSSTSSGAIAKSEPEARELFEFIQNEVSEALKTAKSLGIGARALFWIVPEFEKYGVTTEKALQSNLYSGLKIHPHTFFDRYDVPEQDNIIDRAFKTARDRNLPILLHTGIDKGLNEPERFEDFFVRYSDVRATLAHCRKVKTCIEYLKRFPQLTGDTAFADDETLEQIAVAGFASRLKFGTDFPVTHHFARRHEPSREGDVSAVDLIAQYRADLKM